MICEINLELSLSGSWAPKRVVNMRVSSATWGVWTSMGVPPYAMKWYVWGLVGGMSYELKMKNGC